MRYQPTRAHGAVTVRPIVFIDSSRSVCHRRARDRAELGALDDAAVALARPVRLDHVDDAARARRHDADAVGEHRRLVERVRDEEHGGAESRATGAGPRRPSAAASAGRARRTARRAGCSRGCITSVRAMHTRWRMPPESCAGIARRRSRTGRRASATSRHALVLLRRARASARRRPNATLPATSSHGKRRVLLEHDADAVGRLARDRPSFELDRALGRGRQPRDELEQRRLAAARRARRRRRTRPCGCSRSIGPTACSGAGGAPRHEASCRRS